MRARRGDGDLYLALSFLLLSFSAGAAYAQGERPEPASAGQLPAGAAVEAPVGAPSDGSGDEVAVPYTSFILANGLTVVVHEDRRVPLAAVLVLYHVGSGREEPGKTGFAHLFEHVMFEGSARVPEGAFDVWLEQAGGNNNGFTGRDYTGYYEVVPTNALELALFLEADRMASLLETMDQRKLDVQRDVVKNERRQNYDNQPYGLAPILLAQASFPPGHPYHWTGIGSMSDLSAASLEDVRAFFRRWYVPSNATLVVAGDVDPGEVRRLVEKHFGGIARGAEPPPFHAPPARLEEEVLLVLQDDVQLPRLHLSWITPAYFAPGDAALDLLAGLLAGGKSSRLYRRLVYKLELAQDVAAFQSSGKVASTFEIQVTARSGHGLEEVLRVIDEELEQLRGAPPALREVRRALHLYEAAFYDDLEPAIGRALQLAAYDYYTENPGFFQETLAAHRAVSAADLQEAARRYLSGGRVLLSVVPAGKTALALPGSSVAREENP
jgi:zinc protease